MHFALNVCVWHESPERLKVSKENASLKFISPKLHHTYSDDYIDASYILADLEKTWHVYSVLTSIRGIARPILRGSEHISFLGLMKCQSLDAQDPPY